MRARTCGYNDLISPARTRLRLRARTRVIHARACATGVAKKKREKVFAITKKRHYICAMKIDEIIDAIKAAPFSIKIVAVIAAAALAACVFFTSCNRRTFAIRASGERVEFSYKDSLIRK